MSSDLISYPTPGAPHIAQGQTFFYVCAHCPWPIFRALPLLFILAGFFLPRYLLDPSSAPSVLLKCLLLHWPHLFKLPVPSGKNSSSHPLLYLAPLHLSSLSKLLIYLFFFTNFSYSLSPLIKISVLGRICSCIIYWSVLSIYNRASHIVDTQWILIEAINK